MFQTHFKLVGLLFFAPRLQDRVVFPDDQRAVFVLGFNALQAQEVSNGKNLFGENDTKERRDFLFSIGLFKGYMSSPNAALKSLLRRIEKLNKRSDKSEAVEDNIDLLKDLCDTMVNGSLCAMGGMTPYPVLSALKYYPQDFGISSNK